MATVSKDKKEIRTLKDEFERRNLNAKSVMNIIKYLFLKMKNQC